MTAESAPDADPLLTVRDAMERLNIGRTWLYDALNEGRVQGVRLGRAWRVRESVIAQLAQAGAPAA